jgi:D-alanine-D-alanine ligase
MRVAILHNAVSSESSVSDRDVLVQVAAVDAALERAGHATSRITVTLDLSLVRQQLEQFCPDVVFNLVESLEGCDWLMILATGLLDAMGVPYTGARTESLVLANHKLLAKQRLQQRGLPTPDWIGEAYPGSRGPGGTPPCGFQPEQPYVLKAVSQHASLGLDDDCVVAAADEADLRRRLAAQAERLGCPCFAERYVEGREFNLSVLGRAGQPTVLPPAEIDFSQFPAGKPRIVGYRAKWMEDSPEYRHTPRSFEFAPSQQPLLDQLATLARDCWDLFGLAGYARVDFRVDTAGQPWILEINANPCLSPDAGFAAALDRARLGFDRAVQHILHDALGCAGRSMPV